MGSSFIAQAGFAVETHQNTEEDMLNEVIVGENAMLYISPHMQKSFDQDRVVSFIKGKQEDSSDEINFTPLIISELAEEDITKLNNEKWIAPQDKITQTIHEKFDSYLEKKKVPILIIIERDNKEYELYKYDEKENDTSLGGSEGMSSYEVTEVEGDLLKHVEDVNTATEVFLDADMDMVEDLTLGVIPVFLCLALFIALVLVKLVKIW